MQFKNLAIYFEKLEATPSRLKMTEILAGLFKEASVEEIGKICYLSLGRLVPLYESLEFQLAEKMVMRAIAAAEKTELNKVQREYKNLGDLGKVLEQLEVKSEQQRTNHLTVLNVYEKLHQIATDAGTGSQDRKVKALAELLQNLNGGSGKYVVRMVVGKLRLGFSDKTIIDALSWMVKGNKSLRETLEGAYFVRADIGELAKIVRSSKLKIKSVLGKIQPELGVPVMPALCQRLNTAQEMIAKMGQVAVEPKFDGTRVQIQIKGREWLRTFTRNLEESTPMFPELKQAYKQIKAKEVILDSEGIGVDPKTGKWLPFQDTMVRKRKYNVTETSRKVPLKFYVFDLLYKDGKSLLDRPLRERREILEKLISGQGPLEITGQIVTDKVNELRQYHTQQLGLGLEGVVVKQWEGKYEPGRRGFNWVKFKEEEKTTGGLSDTLDCVVMGYYRGRGKRAGFGIGAFLVGIRKGEQLVTIAKVGTGLSDEQWKQLRAKSEKVKTENMPKEYVVDKSLIPDVWITPKIVVEIAADNLTRSPNHSAGWALRFPRLIRFREDKHAGEATSLAEVRRMT